MTEILENVLIPIVAIVAVFGSLFGAFYFWITRRHVERLALIETGHAAALAPNAGATLRVACVFIGLGAGLVAGWVLTSISEVPQFVAYMAGPCFGLGAGLLVYLRSVARESGAAA